MGVRAELSSAEGLAAGTGPAAAAASEPIAAGESEIVLL